MEMLIANNAAGKCHGQAPDGTQICDKRDQCGRYLRPEGDRQAWGNFWKRTNCDFHEIVPVELTAQ